MLPPPPRPLDSVVVPSTPNELQDSASGSSHVSPPYTVSVAQAMAGTSPEPATLVGVPVSAPAQAATVAQAAAGSSPVHTMPSDVSAPYGATKPG